MKKLFLVLSAILISLALCFVSCADKKTASDKTVSTETQNNQIKNNEQDDTQEDTQNNTQENVPEIPQDDTQDDTQKDVQDSSQDDVPKDTQDDVQDNVQDDAVKEVFILENNSFEKALKTVIGKDNLTEDDLLSIYYMAVTPSANGKYNLCVGFFNYIEAYYKELSKENPDPSALIPYAFDTDFVLEDGVFLENDLARFKNVEVFEFYDFNINDVSFIKNYPNLVYGYFASNGIKDVSSLSDYNPEILLQLDLSGNPISDWSPLKHLEDKVVVVYSPETGMSLTLKEFSTMTPAEAPEVVPEVIPETTPETETQPEPEAETPAEEEKSAEEIAKEIAENLDLGALFE